MGRQALLVLPLGPAAVLQLYRALSGDPLPGQIDLVPGAESLLVLFARDAEPGVWAELERRIRRVQVGEVCLESAGSSATWGNARGREFETHSTDLIESVLDDTDPSAAVPIDTVYDGPDLAEVAALTGMSPEAVVAVHTGTLWQVAFCGFAPGFAYLRPGDSDDAGVARSERIAHSPDRENLPEALTGGNAPEITGTLRRDVNSFGSRRAPGPGAASSQAPVLNVPRRDSPRPAIDAGSVGLAGPYSGIYPGPSPGGWQLIGRTDAPLWDLRRDPPALLRPGMQVRFRPVRASMTIPSPKPPPAAPTAPQPGSAHASDSGTGSPRERHLTVLRPGVQCLIQDLGRAGHAALGVSPSGAADRGAALAANRAVGNPQGAPVLEILLGGAAFEAGADLTIALAGAPVPVTIASPEPSAPGMTTPATDPDPDPAARLLHLPAGARFTLGRPRSGLRVYLAVAGGIEVPTVLGSSSADVLGHLGPEPVKAGDRLPLGVPAEPNRSGPPPNGARADHARTGIVPSATTPTAESPEGASGEAATYANGTAADTKPPHPAALPGSAGPEGVVIIDLTPGPQADPRALAALTDATWTVSPASNRVAVRLTGSGLEQFGGHTLPSQGLVRGAIQLPPSGELVVFLADYPVTGGYPVIAVADQVDRLAQVRPGATVRFRMAG